MRFGDGIVVCVLLLGLVVLWQSFARRSALSQELRETSANLRISQLQQQVFLNRVEYRLAQATDHFKAIALDVETEQESVKSNRQNNRFQTSLQRASADIHPRPSSTLVQSLKDHNVELLDKLKQMEDNIQSRTKSTDTFTQSAEHQGILQQKLSQKIDELEVDISTKVQSLQEKYPFVHGVIAELTDAAAQLQDVENEIRGITDELRHQTWLTSKHYATIGHLAQEQKFGDDPPKVGTTLCFSIIMQNDIDSGQAQTVSRLYRKMCDKYIQFGEGQLLVPIEDASGDEPYILGQHVVQLDLSMPSSHAENWEKLNSALSYIMANLFQFDFFLKVDPDTYFFSGNYNYFMAYMARKWGNRFYQEPLYAGLPLHHNAPAYNSGHVYILNRESMSLVVSALTESRRVFGKEGRAAAKEHTLTCAWSNPHENKFLAGCAHGCKAVATLDEAMSFCELLPGCGGVVDLGEAADSQRFQLRASTRPEDSAFGETSYVMSCTDENVIPEKEDSASQCAFSLRVPEDLQLGHCLYSLGVRPWDTRDNRGREFLSFTDPKTWSQGFATVMTVPWYYRGRYFDNYGTLSKHLADRIVSIHVGYDPTLLACWPQIYDAVISMEPGSDGGRKTISTTGAIGEWFDNHRYEIVGTGVCSTK